MARRWPGRDRGSFTAELAVGLPALMLLLFAGVGVVDAVATKGRCVDAARAGALAAARGEPVTAGVAPPGAVVTVVPDGEAVRVVVRCRIRGITVDAGAVAAREPGGAR